MSEFKRLAIPHAGHESKRTQYGYTAYWTQASKFELMNRLGEYEDTGFTPEEIRGMIRDAPRVLTWDELYGFDGAVLVEYNPDHLDRRDEWMFVDYIADTPRPTAKLYRRHGEMESYRRSGYGKSWRAWTARPTEEQREAEPWM